MPAAKSRARVAAHRAALRAQGLRPIQLWVPDTRTPEFKELARQEARRSAIQADEAAVMQWIERNSIFDNEDA